jgi:hypothetical protein
MPKLPDEITVTLTKEEALVLLSGAVKGNVVYGSVASRDGQTTLRLCEMFAKEFGITPFPSDAEPSTPPSGGYR